MSTVLDWMKTMLFACSNCNSAEDEHLTEHSLINAPADKEIMILEYEKSIY